MNKLSGGFGEQVIVAFNHSSEQKTTVDDIPLNNAPEHYSFLSEECSKKIMLTHRITSPLLVGLRDLSGGGLGSNAEEIQNAQKLFSNTTIKPYQDLIIESLDEILEANGIALNLYFKTLDPLDFMDINIVGNDDEIEEETGVKVDEETEIEMLSHKTCFKGLKDEELNILAEELIKSGEDEDIEGYELIDTQEATENEDGILSHFEFANVLKSSPAKKSKQDTSLFKVRYKYFPAEVSKNGRELDKESSANSELAATGQSTYNIWLYKGGANCKHGWIRNIYLRRNNKKISVGQARKMINSLPIANGERKAAKYEDNDKKVAMRPYDMPNHGYKNPRTKKKK